MIVKRPAGERGHADHGWLDTHHTFSFGQYHDPAHMGFRTLRVINDDIIQPGQGFGTHGHRDMEIVSYVVSGALEHQDSMGNGSILRPGDVQRMTAGRGIRHSEFNPSDTEPGRFLQIWILPEREGLEPGWEEKHFDPADRQGRLQLIVSPEGGDGALKIHQDVRIYASRLAPGETLTQDLRDGRAAWVQVIRGRVDLDGVILAHGDGAAVSEVDSFTLAGIEEAELLVFDLA